MAFRFRPVYFNEVKSPFFIFNNTKSVYELSKICISLFMFMLYGRLLNLLPTYLFVQVYSPKLTESCCICVGLWVEICGPWDTKPVDLSGSDPI